MGTEDYSIIAKHQECFLFKLSQTKENHKIWNSILHMDIDVYMENIETGGTGYMAQFIYNGVCYYLSGAIEQNDFDEMLKKIHF